MEISYVTELVTLTYDISTSAFLPQDNNCPVVIFIPKGFAAGDEISWRYCRRFEGSPLMDYRLPADKLGDSNGVAVYNRRDIWASCPDGSVPALCFTQGNVIYIRDIIPPM